MRLDIFQRRLRHDKKLKLYWFRHKYPEYVNFGDELSRDIVEKLSGKKVEWADRDSCEMVAVGSVLREFLTRKSKNNVIVWGTGLILDYDSQLFYDKKTTDIRMVRGKLTAGKLGLDNETYGDPGLLASLLYKPSENIKKVGLVPHYVDKDNPIIEKLSHNKEIKIINVYDKPSKVISEIASCELIISSSLHGIIVGHSFGIPAYWVELSSKVAGSGFKFRDYYSIFDAKPAKLDIKTLDDITKHADELIKNYVWPQNVEAIKRSMISVFPKDI